MASVTLEELAFAWGVAVFPWLRLMRVGFSFIAAPRVDLLSNTRVSLRVWPNDLDINFHVNNGRYLALADIGRIHWFVLTGVLDAARRQKAHPVVGDALAKFRRDLKAFESFEILTRLIGWNQKWAFMEHRFVRNERVIGLVVVRGIFKGPAGTIDPGVLLSELAHTAPSPELPEWANAFQRSSELVSGMLREEERAQGLSGRQG